MYIISADLAQTCPCPSHDGRVGERVAEYVLSGAERVLSVLESVLCHSVADRVADRAKWLASGGFEMS